jgi:rod shape determining protein RodA
MSQNISSKNKLDWPLILLYLCITLVGWATIYSASYSAEASSIFDTKYTFGKQMVWIMICTVIAILILNIESKFFTTFAYVYYGVTIVLLVPKPG